LAQHSRYINSVRGANRLWASNLWGESSLGRDVHGAKRPWGETSTGRNVLNNNNNTIYIAQIHAQQQMGCRVISVQNERLSA